MTSRGVGNLVLTSTLVLLVVLIVARLRGHAEATSVRDPAAPAHEVADASPRLSDSATPSRSEVSPEQGAEGRTASAEDVPVAADAAPAPAAAPMGDAELWFLVTDAQGNQLAEASITVSWELEGRRGAIAGKPREEDGYTWIGGCPEGLVTVEARCEGYVPQSHAMLVPVDPPRIATVALRRSTSVAGVVTRGGEPPGPVQVFYWSEGLEGAASSRRVEDASRGEFVIEGIPAGMVYLEAASARFGLSEVVRVDAGSGQPPPFVELELAGGIAVTGIVVDQATRQPVRGGETQLIAAKADLASRIVPIGEIGPSSPVDADGYFELQGAKSGVTAVRISAPGYSSFVGLVDGDGPVLDLGSISLVPSQSLTICLDSDRGLDATRYAVTSPDGRIEKTAFPADGCLTFRDFSAGDLVFYVQGPDKDHLFWVTTYLESGKSWNVQLPVEGYGELAVRFEPRTREPDEPSLLVDYESRHGVDIQRIVTLHRFETLRFDGMPDVHVSARLRLSDGSIVASANGAFEGAPELVLTIGADSKALRVRVEDLAGRPIPGVSVTVASPEPDAGGATRVTDGQGECELQGLPDGSLLAMLAHPTIGFRPSMPVVRPEDPGTPLVLRLHPDSSLELVVESMGLAVPGATYLIGDTVLTYVFDDPQQTSDSGVLRFPPLHAGAYLVQVRHPEHFPFDGTFQVAGTTRDRVQLRKRGTLELLVTDDEGVPLAALPVALSFEDGSSVEPWAARGWIELPPGGLTTDARGVLSVDGLAAGTYTWTAGGSSGSVAVDPDTRNPVTVVVR